MRDLDLKSPVIPLCFTIFGAFAAVFGGLGIAIGLILVTIGSVWQYRATQPFVRLYSNHDWTPTEGESYRLPICEREHHKGKNITVSNYCEEGNLFALCMPDVYSDNHGNIEVQVRTPMCGKIVIT